MSYPLEHVDNDQKISTKIIGTIVTLGGPLQKQKACHRKQVDIYFVSPHREHNDTQECHYEDDGFMSFPIDHGKEKLIMKLSYLSLRPNFSKTYPRLAQPASTILNPEPILNPNERRKSLPEVACGAKVAHPANGKLAI